MATESAFHELMRRVRQGDEQAAADLVGHFGPQVRRVVRTWLRPRQTQLRRVFDSLDICQSVWSTFCQKFMTGQYEVTDPADLIKLLGVLARHRVRKRVRQHYADRRDVRRSELREPEELPDPAAASPSLLVADRDLWEEIRRRLTAEEWALAEARREGRGWAEIAAALGGTADGRRMQLTRAVQRAAQELGLDLGG
jgi:RNA polymerase sigma-70 factor (ECF subfamily)